MSKQLYFYYSAMNAGKTTSLIQTAYNYCERNMRVVILKPAVDNREQLITTEHPTSDSRETQLQSRIGIYFPSLRIEDHDNLFTLVEQLHQQQKIDCVLIDEVQFIQPEQVYQLADICDYLNIPVLCYGLRTDYRAKLFPATSVLLGLADKLSEIKTICFCGKKAILTLRFNHDEVIADGNPVHIGDNDEYISVCRYHYKESIKKGRTIRQ